MTTVRAPVPVYRLAIGDTVQLKDAYGDGTRGKVMGRTLDGRFVDVNVPGRVKLINVHADSFVLVEKVREKTSSHA